MFDDLLSPNTDPFLKKNQPVPTPGENLEAPGKSPGGMPGVPAPAAPSTTASGNGGGWNTGNPQKNWSTGRKPKDVWNTSNP